MSRLRVKLTRTEIGKLEPRSDGKPDLRWDTELAGFGVLVSGKTGRKTYVVQINCRTNDLCRPPCYRPRKAVA